MLRARPPGKAPDLLWLLAARPFQTAIGLGMLVPGFLQCRWSQRQRGWAFFGTFASALLVGLWAWGSPLSWAFLSLAFVTHTASVTDVLRQASFPVYPARRAVIFVSGALALLLYAPAVAGLSIVAWPGFEPASSGMGYLVNRFAYRSADPCEGQWIWMHPSAKGEPRAAQVVAISGQEVEWTGQTWKVDGSNRSLHSPGRLTSWPQACKFTVPPHQILVEPRDDGVSKVPVGPIVLVSPDRIIGRAWAQFYPVWDRHML